MFSWITGTLLVFAIVLVYAVYEYIQNMKRFRNTNVPIGERRKWKIEAFLTVSISTVVGTAVVFLAILMLSMVGWHYSTAESKSVVEEQRRALNPIDSKATGNSPSNPLFIKITREKTGGQDHLYYEFNSSDDEMGKRVETISEKTGGEKDGKDKIILLYHDDLPANAKPYMVIIKNYACKQQEGFESYWLFDKDRVEEPSCVVESPKYEEWHFYVHSGTVFRAYEEDNIQEG